MQIMFRGGAFGALLRFASIRLFIFVDLRRSSSVLVNFINWLG